MFDFLNKLKKILKNKSFLNSSKFSDDSEKYEGLLILIIDCISLVIFFRLSLSPKLFNEYICLLLLCSTNKSSILIDGK